MKYKVLRKARQRMIRAVAYLTKYMVTYDKQLGYADYSDKTYLDDVLYGLGASLDDKYKNADGYDRFKKVLLEHLGVKPAGLFWQTSDGKKHFNEGVFCKGDIHDNGRPIEIAYVGEEAPK